MASPEKQNIHLTRPPGTPQTPNRLRAGLTGVLATLALAGGASDSAIANDSHHGEHPGIEQTGFHEGIIDLGPLGTTANPSMDSLAENAGAAPYSNEYDRLHPTTRSEIDYFLKSTTDERWASLSEKRCYGKLEYTIVPADDLFVIDPATGNKVYKGGMSFNGNCEIKIADSLHGYDACWIPGHEDGHVLDQEHKPGGIMDGDTIDPNDEICLRETAKLNADRQATFDRENADRQAIADREAVDRAATANRLNADNIRLKALEQTRIYDSKLRTRTELAEIAMNGFIPKATKYIEKQATLGCKVQRKPKVKVNPPVLCTLEPANGKKDLNFLIRFKKGAPLKTVNRRPQFTSKEVRSPSPRKKTVRKTVRQ